MPISQVSISPKRRFTALENMFADLKPNEMESLRKCLQIYLDPSASEKTDLQKLNELEKVLEK